MPFFLFSYHDIPNINVVLLLGRLQFGLFNTFAIVWSPGPYKYCKLTLGKYLLKVSFGLRGQNPDISYNIIIAGGERS